MRMKTFLLGSAAALGVGGVAQAADLSVSYSEPVDYVRVCDAFGAGYYYIPGTDTCLKIGGYVRFQVEYGDPQFTVSGSPGGYEAYDNDTNVYVDGDQHYANWRFKARANLQITAQSQTDWGPLIGYMEFEANFGPSDGDVTWAEPSNAFVSLGPFTAGIYQSNFDTGGSYTSAYQLDEGYGVGFTSDKPLQVQLSWAFNGFGIIIAAEDPNFRPEGDWADNTAQSDVPDLVAALTGEWGNIAAKVAFLYRDTSSSTWGVQGNVVFSDIINALDVQLAAFYIDSGTNTGPYTSGDSWGGQISAKYNWTSMFSTAITAQYVDYSAVNGAEGWNLAFGADYKPVDDFLIRFGIKYLEDSDTTNALVEFRRSFGG